MPEQDLVVTVIDKPPHAVEADTLCIGLFEPAELATELDASLAEPIGLLIESGEAKGKPKRSALTHVDGKRVVLVGLGKRDRFDAETARVVAAVARKVAGQLETKRMAWALPVAEDTERTTPEEIAAALVEGTVLAGYKFDRYKSSEDENGDEDEDDGLEELVLLGPDSLGNAAQAALAVARATNRARDLQNLPANEATPEYLANRALELATRFDSVSAEVLGSAAIEQLGMGGIIAVGKGSEIEPKLIVVRYRAAGAKGPATALVGKAVTFDSGGISIKSAARMHEMKMDMSGGAAVIEAIGAIAELGLAADIIGVIPAAENMPSGRSIKPGDIVTMHNGKTVEVNNTDAEGRLLLADALSYATELGAERLIDLATLTGAIVVALGSTYAGLVSNDDELAGAIEAAAQKTGELAWRLPLHEEYKELTKGTIADLSNASEKRKAGPLYAAAFLEEFVDGRPWAHLDIAGTSWDVGRPYVGNGPTGYGVRLLVELTRNTLVD